MIALIAALEGLHIYWDGDTACWSSWSSCCELAGHSVSTGSEPYKEQLDGSGYIAFSEALQPSDTFLDDFPFRSSSHIFCYFLWYTQMLALLVVAQCCKVAAGRASSVACHCLISTRKNFKQTCIAKHDKRGRTWKGDFQWIWFTLLPLTCAMIDSCLSWKCSSLPLHDSNCGTMNSFQLQRLLLLIYGSLPFHRTAKRLYWLRRYVHLKPHFPKFLPNLHSVTSVLWQMSFGFNFICPNSDDFLIIPITNISRPLRCSWSHLACSGIDQLQLWAFSDWHLPPIVNQMPICSSGFLLQWICRNCGPSNQNVFLVLVQKNKSNSETSRFPRCPSLFSPFAKPLYDESMNTCRYFSLLRSEDCNSLSSKHEGHAYHLPMDVQTCLMTNLFYFKAAEIRVALTNPCRQHERSNEVFLHLFHITTSGAVEKYIIWSKINTCFVFWCLSLGSKLVPLTARM